MQALGITWLWSKIEIGSEISSNLGRSLNGSLKDNSGHGHNARSLGRLMEFTVAVDAS